MDPIKEAFNKIKQDMDSLREEITLIRKGILELHERISSQVFPLQALIQTDKPTDKPTDEGSNWPLEALKGQNTYSSI